MRKLVSVFVLVLAVLALSTGIAFAGPNGTDRPLKGNSTSTTTIDLATLTGTSDGTSQLTHCGRAHFHNDFTFNFLPGGNFSLVGTDTEVCANGDELFSSFVITGSLSAGTSTGTFTGTGGTGRFVGASGSFTTVNTSTIVSVVGTVITSQDSNTIDGLISY
jgi:hypothetical protein